MSAAARTMDGAVREASGHDLHAEMRGATRVYAGGIHALAATELRLRRVVVHRTCEPSGGPTGSLIRQILSHRLVVPGEVLRTGD